MKRLPLILAVMLLCGCAEKESLKNCATAGWNDDTIESATHTEGLVTGTLYDADARIGSSVDCYRRIKIKGEEYFIKANCTRWDNGELELNP